MQSEPAWLGEGLESVSPHILIRTAQTLLSIRPPSFLPFLSFPNNRKSTKRAKAGEGGRPSPFSPFFCATFIVLSLIGLRISKGPMKRRQRRNKASCPSNAPPSASPPLPSQNARQKTSQRRRRRRHHSSLVHKKIGEFVARARNA